MSKGRIYLDHHATTPADARVVAVVVKYLTEAFGNAHSVDHDFGAEAEGAVERARSAVAALVGADSPRSVIFTSGATEALNLGIQGFVREHARPGAPVRIALTPLEHRAVIDVCEALANEGLAHLDYVPVDHAGRINISAFASACRTGAHLACVMAANNEIGTIHPIHELAGIAAENGTVLLTDATQAAGRIELKFSAWGIGLLALSGHKMYGPKGVGALVLAPTIRIRPLFFGGGHERGLRPGTLDVPSIAGFGEACRLRSLEMETDESVIAARRDRLWDRIRIALPEAVLNGDPVRRLAENLHISIPGVPNTAIMARIGHRLAASTGSACSSGTIAVSHVLRSLDLPEDIIEGALRFGVGKGTTEDEIDAAAEFVVSAVHAIRTSMGIPILEHERRTSSPSEFPLASGVYGRQ